jgi:membrane associated rhomboid family serine protease
VQRQPGGEDQPWAGAPEPAGGPPGAPPTCFRHPGRETYVSCVRCGRYACPDCLRSAPVGQQCVDCIREGQRGTPRATTVFGGRITSGALLTWVLVGVNVVIYLGEVIDRKLIDYFAMIGHATDPALGGQIVGVGAGQWYRLITAAFLHEAPLPLHILFNMWALIIVGPPLERLLGRTRFLTLYLLSALGGSVLFYLIGPPTQLSLGASGAIFGLFGAYFVVARRLRADTRGIVILIVINLVISFTIPDIAWQAHIGGLVTGGAVMAAYAYAPRPQRLLIQAGASAVMLALLVIGVVLRTHQLSA